VYCGRISMLKKEAGLMPNRLATRHETELEGRMFRLLAGNGGGGVKAIFGLASILHGPLHVVTHRAGVRARCSCFRNHPFRFSFSASRHPDAITSTSCF
jgi:hypothetical protein